jgi:predicted transcriptional regulator
MKTLMVSFQPKWARMILSGEKKYEFRQGNFVNAKTDDKFLILESLGKKVICWNHPKCQGCNNYDSPSDYCLTDFKTNEGTGKVIGEFIVGEVYKNDIGISHDRISLKTHDGIYTCIWKEEWVKQGYTNQPLAFEITQLKIYDTPRDKSEYMLYNPLNDWLSNTIDLVDEEQMYATKEYAIRKNMFRVKRSPQSFCRVIDTV